MSALKAARQMRENQISSSVDTVMAEHFEPAMDSFGLSFEEIDNARTRSGKGVSTVLPTPWPPRAR